MEQRIEIIDGQQGSCLEGVKERSDELLKEGWFVQEMVAYDFVGQGYRVNNKRVLVVYRRKA